MGLVGLAFAVRGTQAQRRSVKVVVFEEKPVRIHFRLNGAELDTAMWITVEYCCGQRVDRERCFIGQWAELRSRLRFHNWIAHCCLDWL